MALIFRVCIAFTLLFSVVTDILAQPIGCSAPTPAQSCGGSCIACDGLDGFNSSMIMGGPGQTIPGYCTQVVHNMQYIGFIAGSTAVSIQVNVSGCNSNIGTGGMEAGIYASTDCNNFTLSSNCNTNIPNGTSAVITGAGLTVGECYYLVMDGNGPNSCSYSLAVLAGSTQAPMVPNSGIITGPNLVCSGGAYTYQVTPLPCMQSHTWTLNGSPIGMGSSVNVSFPGPGTYQLCAEANAICNNIPPSCRTIVIPPSTPTQVQFPICLGDCVDINGSQYCSPGLYPVTFTASNGCDSTVNYLITQLPFTAPTVQPVQLCANECVIINGDSYCSPGLVSITYTSSFGCDSVINYLITTLPPLVTSLNAQICQGQTYFFNSQNLSASGTYLDTLQSSVTGCDSLIALTLRVAPSANTQLSQEICNGQSLIFGNQILTSSGTYTRTLLAVSGCDSMVTLNLTVRATITTAQTAQICQGQTYPFGPQVLSNPGTYLFTSTAANGCDSLITLILGVTPSANAQITAQICSGQSLTFGNQNLITAGTYTRTITSSTGCDSIITLSLSVVPALTTALSAQICNGQMYAFGAQNLTSTGTYTRTITSSTGCDSIITLSLSVVPALTTALSAQICNGQTYNFGAQNLTSTGTYTRAINSSVGCDSIITLNLSVVPALSTTLSVQICNGQTYAFGAQNLTSTGTYTRAINSSVGCDSIITLNLSVVPALSTPLSAQICNGQTYAFGAQNLTSTGTYSRTITSSAGCDSIITLSLSVVPVLTTTLSAQICNGQIYAFGAQNLTSTGNYSRTITSTAGCDSIITLSLSVVPVLTTALSVQICNGQMYAFGAQNLTSTGTYSRTITSSAGCDSIITLNLSVVPVLTTALSVQICNGQTYAFGAQNLTSTGTYTRTISSSTGCDSIITLNLSVVPVLTTALSVQICNGQTYAFGAQNLTSTGTYTRTITSISGCDSIITLNLSVVPVLTTALSAQICNGQAYAFGAQNLTSAGSYTQSITSSGGCDSMIQLTLSIVTPVPFNIGAQICAGQSYNLGSQNLTSSGVYTWSTTSSLGCDSTMIVSLNVLPASSSSSSVQICNGQTFTFGSQVLEASGIYSRTVPSYIGCDSVITLDLRVVPVLTTSLNAEICDGQSFSFGSQSLTSSGVFTMNLPSSGGCDSIITLELNILPPLQLNLGPTQEVDKGEILQLNSSSNYPLSTVQWQPASLVDCDVCPNTQTVAILSDAVFTLSALSEDGCAAMQTLSIRVKDDPSIYVPNVLRPGSVDNGNFTVYSNGAIEKINLLRIYDRWGSGIFELKDFPDSAPQFGWDGSYRNRELNPGVYVWYAEILLKNGEVVMHRGDVTVVR